VVVDPIDDSNDREYWHCVVNVCLSMIVLGDFHVDASTMERPMEFVRYCSSILRNVRLEPMKSHLMARTTRMAANTSQQINVNSNIKEITKKKLNKHLYC
jgi:hypothetical protein